MVSSMGMRVVASASERDECVERELLGRGIEYVGVSMARNAISPLRDLALFFKYFFLFRKYKPDYVLSYTVKPVVYGCVAAWLARVPVRGALITGLGGLFSNDKPRVLRVIALVIYKIALTASHKVFFQNEHDMEYFIRNRVVSRKKSVRVMGSGVRVRADVNITYPSNIVFLMISRLLKEKGVEEYLRAAKSLKLKYPGVRFLLGGWIDSHGRCISSKTLDDYVNCGAVEYLGRIEDVQSVLQSSSVFVLPSYYKEGVPRTILEAMAESRAVITTDMPGCKDTVIPGWNGYLVPARKWVELAAAMERFILDDSLVRIFGENSKLHAIREFDVDRVNADIVSSLMGLRIESQI